jgi:hypothetical protein
VVIELIGIEVNTCGGREKKDWLLKVSLLINEEYVGFLQKGESNIAKKLSEYVVKGKLLNRAKQKILRFEDIEKISFFAR